jgi:aspartate carbamoyltransferase catalytic subunit
MLRIQAERLAGLQLDLDEYRANYQLTGQQLAAHAPNAVVLHPGPIIRGMEITAGVADGVQSAILEQVTNGLAIRMAVMERALLASDGAPAETAGSGRSDSSRWAGNGSLAAGADQGGRA